jgi:hypothetical protein
MVEKKCVGKAARAYLKTTISMLVDSARQAQKIAMLRDTQSELADCTISM